MSVLIPALGEDCAAATALAVEGVPTQTRIMDSEEDYGRFLAENWRGEVIVIEHDVIPWPGAIAALSDCPEPWCVHQYAFSHREPRVIWALGCLRVNKILVDAHPDLPDYWQGVLWHGVASEVVDAIRTVSTREPHIHYPPFAHLRANGRSD